MLRGTLLEEVQNGEVTFDFSIFYSNRGNGYYAPSNSHRNLL